MVLPRLSISPHQYIYREDNVVLQCTVSGTGNFTYMWYKDNKALSTWTNQSILINTIRISDSGVYMCSVSNGVLNKISNTMKINVQCM